MSRVSDAGDRIVRAAAALFITRSYHAVGVEELCGAAGVQKGSFYHYFSSKAELLKAVVDFHSSALLARLDRLPAVEPIERLHMAADVIARTQLELASRFGRVVGCPFGNLAAELSTTDEDVRKHVAAALAQIEARIAAITDRRQLDAGTDPADLARTLMAQYHGVILMAKVNADDATALAPALHRVIDTYVRHR